MAKSWGDLETDAEKLRAAGEGFDRIGGRMECFECCGRGFVVFAHPSGTTYHHCSRCGGTGRER